MPLSSPPIPVWSQPKPGLFVQMSARSVHSPPAPSREAVVEIPHTQLHAGEGCMTQSIQGQGPGTPSPLVR